MNNQHTQAFSNTGKDSISVAPQNTGGIMNKEFWTNRRQGAHSGKEKEHANLESTAHGGPTNARRAESVGRGGLKKKVKNNPFEVGSPGDNITVYKTLHTNNEDSNEQERGLLGGGDLLDTANHQGPIESRESSSFNQKAARSNSLSMSRQEEFNEVAEANISRAMSQLTDKLSQKLANHDLQYLRQRLIEPERITQLFPEYFNEPVPPFSLKNLKLGLSISMLVALLEDNHSGIIHYLTWGKRKHDNLVDAAIKIIPKDKVSDEKLLRLLDSLEEFPSDTMAALGVALHLFNTIERKQPEAVVAPRFCHMLSRFESMPFTKLNCLRNNKLVVLQGRITLKTTPKLLVLAAPYLCSECGTEFIMHYRDGLFRTPFKCSNIECGGKNFTMIKTKAKISVIQRFVVQEIGGDRDQRFMGLANCEVRDSIIPNLKLNKVAIISGIWKIEPAAKANTKTVTTKGIYDHYLDVKNVEYREDYNRIQISHDPGMQMNLPGKNFTFQNSQDDRVNFALANCPLTFYSLVGSFCPNVPGQELAKSCLLLTLVGGSNPADLFSQEQKGEEFLRTAFREKIHTLLLGERGVGKTEFLKFIEGLSPDSKFCSSRQLLRGKSE